MTLYHDDKRLRDRVPSQRYYRRHQWSGFVF